MNEPEPGDPAGGEAPASPAQLPGPDDTARIELDAAVPPPPPPPHPKPVILPERTADGWRTPSLILRRTGATGFYLGVEGHDQRNVIHFSESQLEGLYAQLEAAPGALWRKLCEIPLERPRPSRALEEELRTLLVTFSTDLRRRR